MTWLTWRQHRAQLILTGALVGAIAAVLVPSGVALSNYVQASGLSACRAVQLACGNTPNVVYQRYGSILFYLLVVLLLMPPAVGILWGAPLLPREFQAGTHRLAWTQSVTRRRWLAAKLAVFAGAAAGSGLLLGALQYWWFQPLYQTKMLTRLEWSSFNVTGVVPAAYTLFAFALAAAAGAFLRRTLPSVVVTVGGFLAARFAVGLWRDRFRPPLHAVYSLGADNPRQQHRGQVLSTDMVDRAGRVVSDDAFNRVCPPTLGDREECIRVQGLQWLQVYQPDSRYWSFQLIEAGIFLALAALLLAATAWWVLRRASSAPATPPARSGTPGAAAR